MQFLWSMFKLERYLRSEKIKQKKASEIITVNRAIFKNMLAKEKIKEHDYGMRRVQYRDIWLLETSIFDWIVPSYSKADPIMEWQNLALGFYFPVDRRIHYIGIKACLECFTKIGRAHV